MNEWMNEWNNHSKYVWFTINQKLGQLSFGSLLFPSLTSRSSFHPNGGIQLSAHDWHLQSCSGVTKQVINKTALTRSKNMIIIRLETQKPVQRVGCHVPCGFHTVKYHSHVNITIYTIQSFHCIKIDLWLVIVTNTTFTCITGCLIDGSERDAASTI